MTHQVENKNIETIKKDQMKIVKLQSIITYMKNPLGDLNHRFEPTEGKISKL